MSKGIFHATSVSHCVGADLDTIIWIETSTLHTVTSFAADVIGIDFTAEIIDFLA